MTEKCYLCEDEIKKTFLDKIIGTIVKIKKGDKNKDIYICNECQKKYKDLKKEINKKEK